MSRKIPFPGYERKRPEFPAIKNLWRLASEQDSCFQAGQISVSFLENFIKTYNLDRSDFVQKLSELFHISGGHHDWDTTKKIMAQSYIVQTYNIQEIFFKDFNEEYRRFKKKSNWQTSVTEGSSTKNLDPFAQLIFNIEANRSAKFKDVPEAKIIQYYRLVRNAIVHSSKEGFNKSEEFFNKNISPIAHHFNGYFKFKIEDQYPAPNSPLEINHYDFAIYSRSLRYLSFLINDACDLSPKEIFDVEIQNTDFKQSMTFYNYLSNEKLKEKLEKKLSGYFRTHYSKNSDDIRAFCISYFDWYEALQSSKMKKSRRNK